MNTPWIRTEKRLDQQIADLNSDFQRKALDPSSPINTVGIATRGTLKRLLKQARDTSDPITVNIQVCPFYDGRGGIRVHYSTFDWAPERQKIKMRASLEALDILRDYFPLRVQFLLADRGIALTDPGYLLSRIGTDIPRMVTLLQDAQLVNVPYEVTTFTDIWVPIDRYTRDSSPEEGDIEHIFKTYGADFEKFTGAYRTLQESFGVGWAFSLCRDYLCESAYIAQYFHGEIYINAESCPPMNTLYQIGTPWKRLVDNNLLVGIHYKA